MPWQLIINLESWWYYLPSYVYFRKCKNSLISVIRTVLETTMTIFTFLKVCFNTSRLIENKVAHKCSNLAAASKIFTFPLYNHICFYLYPYHLSTTLVRSHQIKQSPAFFLSLSTILFVSPTGLWEREVLKAVQGWTHLSPTDKTACLSISQSPGAFSRARGGRVCEFPQQKDITLVFCLLAHKGAQRSCFHAPFLMSRAPGIIHCRSLEWTPSYPVHEINEDLKCFSIHSTIATSYVMLTE